MNWYRCAWASMNLCLSILPTTLLGTLPVGVYLYQAGVLDPAQVTLCLMMALGIVSPLMSATAFINSMKSMQFAVKDTRELLDLPQLSQAEQDVPLMAVPCGCGTYPSPTAVRMGRKCFTIST